MHYLHHKMEKRCNPDLDDTLLTRMRDHDQSAFSAIYKKYWAELYNTTYKRLKDHSQCQDVLQTVFTDLWARRESVDIRNLRAFLHGAVRFQVYKVVHKAKLQSDFINSFDSLLRSADSDEGVIEAELKTLMTAWTEALPAKRRQIFKMRYERGLTTHEIAVELDISQKTVQNQLHSACTELSTKLMRVSSVVVALFFGASS